jgi:hypothetical protein
MSSLPKSESDTLAYPLIFKHPSLSLKAVKNALDRGKSRVHNE